MTQNIYQLSLSFEQILALVEQLPRLEQVKLKQAIEEKTKEEHKEYRTKAFKELMEEVEPVELNFDPEQAKEEYLKEKYYR
jgi:uncharacterized Zn finger protein